MGPFSRGRDRRGTPADLLVLGLGNPGAEYAHTRHNAGADCVALLARRHGGTLKSSSKELSLVSELRVGPHRLVVAFPQTYYNEAGRAAVALIKRHGIDDPRQVVVVHDELDLPIGRLKVKFGGGLAGNNGLRSIKAHLHTDEFVRVRIGVGKPAGRSQGVDHVLNRPGKADRVALDITIEEAADAVELILAEGVERAMERYNRRGE